jgi:3-hydroxyacyl-CoA dehydrogenase
MSLVTRQRHDRVFALSLHHPPVNSLGLSLRQELFDGLQEAFAQPDLEAVLLLGDEKVFCGGADIREFDKPQARYEPTLLTLINLIESAPKLVVAGINGVCMGGGLELALACHYRVCSNKASFALPEIKLGLIPGAGGTQKLPRLMGLEEAFNFMLKGDPVKGVAFAQMGGVDHLIDGDFNQGALSYTEELVAQHSPLKRIRDSSVDYLQHQSFLDFAKLTIQTTAPHYPAPRALVESMSAACTLSFDEGMKAERRLFIELMSTPQCKALRHAFFAERTCSKIPDLGPEIASRPIRAVGIIGAGTMGGGIAMNFLNAGIPVKMIDSQDVALERGVATIRKNYENTLKKGKLSQAELEERMALLTTTLDFNELCTVDLAIEAVFEDMGVKERVFKQLDAVLKPGAILATNTSTLDVNQIASFTTRAADVIGTHFFSPANVMKLLEVVRGQATSKDVLSSVMQIAKTIKKTAVVSGVCDGFIGNRMLEHYVRMSVLLVEEGASPAQVDGALEKWGMVMGPFRMSDLAGNDIGWAIRKRRYVEKPHVIYSRLADAICEAGRFGQKTGLGWYRYESGQRKALVDPTVTEIIDQFRRSKNILPKKFTDTEIVERTIYALINEGARIVQEGIALRSSDIDVVYLTGYGFPPFRGGPMKYADEVGLFHVCAAMKRFRDSTQDDFWQPAPLLEAYLHEHRSLT